MAAGSPTLSSLTLNPFAPGDEADQNRTALVLGSKVGLARICFRARPSTARYPYRFSRFGWGGAPGNRRT